MIIHSIQHWLLTIWQAWDNWWMRQSFPHTIAIVRVVLGLWLLLYWGLRLPHVTMIFSSAGIVLPSPHPWTPEWLVWLWNIPSPTVALTIYASLMVALTCMTIGLFTRISAFIAFLLSIYYFYLSLHLFHTSFDRLYMMALFTISISGAGKWLSVDAWEKNGSPLLWTETTSVFAQRLLAFQITMTYLGVGWQKLWLPGWQGGEMLWFSFLGVWGTDASFWITSTFGWSELYHVMVHAVIAFEVFLPFGFWIKAKGIRWYTMAGGLLFHFFVDMLLFIWWFAVLVPAYIVYFTPEETYQWLRRISGERIK